MELKEIIKVDLIEITESNIIQVRKASIIEKNGVEISRSNHRHVITPIDDISGEDIKVQLIANAIWSKDVISDYKNQLLISKNK